jgi:CRISPR-associated protein Cmx8
MDVRGNPDLNKRIYEIVQQYVFRKTETRCGIEWKDFKDRKNDKGQVDVPQSYREAREKICSGAFLAARSRKSREDFSAFFTGTLCSVPQFIPEEQYALVSEALTTGAWEDVRNLTMLALSGLSRV